MIICVMLIWNFSTT